MLRQRVASSNIESIGFENNVLEVAFHSGSVYQYFGVPESVYLLLMAAPSKGEYLATYVKNRYRYARIS